LDRRVPGADNYRPGMFFGSSWSINLLQRKMARAEHDDEFDDY
jgi:hypothetical protein